MASSADTPPKLLPLKELDPIVFANELIKQNLLPPEATDAGNDAVFKLRSRAGVLQPVTVSPTVPDGLKEGTFKGTQKALTAAYAGLLSSYATYFDIAGFEPSLPRGTTNLDVAKETYNWSKPSAEDDYPPHLAQIPAKDAESLTKIFNTLRLLETGPLLLRIIPEKILDFVNSSPDQGDTIESLVQRNHDLRKTGSGMFSEANIGDRDDWYTDAVFSQQQLIGTNPVTLESASKDWMDGFTAVASKQANQLAVDILTGRASDSDPNDSFYVQDYSWFRQATGLGPSDLIQSDDGLRKSSAPVALFRLTAKGGKLHPLAICIDFKGSLASSVVLFNNRLRVTDDRPDESSDWPWRYAKTVVQCGDWHRHEIGVHLTESHFIEEATIVAANRSFHETHIVHQLLSPHWFKTLSLNAAARSALVPNVIVPIAGMGKNQRKFYALSRYIYKNFDFTNHYIPTDLARRGFPLEELQGTKYHNCAYARDILLFWNVLRRFVSTVLHAEYASDAIVVADDCVSKWCEEMQDPNNGDLKSFPTIRTVEQLIDAVTACIHIASPLHSAVNYLQNYYYAFVISKPPALFTDLPTTLSQLRNINERDLLKALPVDRPREWLIASHIPWLLSYQVADNQNILNWAASLANATIRNPDDQTLSAAARTLHQDLLDLAAVVQSYSEAMDDKVTAYTVLNPKEVAVSILI